MCEDMLSLYCGVFGDEGMTLLNSCQVLKSRPIVFDICVIKPKYSLYLSKFFLPYMLQLSVWVYFL